MTTVKVDRDFLQKVRVLKAQLGMESASKVMEMLLEKYEKGLENGNS